MSCSWYGWCFDDVVGVRCGPAVVWMANGIPFDVQTHALLFDLLMFRGCDVNGVPAMVGSVPHSVDGVPVTPTMVWIVCRSWCHYQDSIQTRPGQHPHQ